MNFGMLFYLCLFNIKWHEVLPLNIRTQFIFCFVCFVFNNSIPLLKRLMSNYIKYILEFVSCFSMGTLGLWRVFLGQRGFLLVGIILLILVIWNASTNHWLSSFSINHMPSPFYRIATMVFNHKALDVKIKVVLLHTYWGSYQIDREGIKNSDSQWFWDLFIYFF